MFYTYASVAGRPYRGESDNLYPNGPMIAVICLFVIYETIQTD